MDTTETTIVKPRTRTRTIGLEILQTASELEFSTESPDFCLQYPPVPEFIMREAADGQDLFKSSRSALCIVFLVQRMFLFQSSRPTVSSSTCTGCFTLGIYSLHTACRSWHVIACMRYLNTSAARLNACIPIMCCAAVTAPSPLPRHP